MTLFQKGLPQQVTNRTGNFRRAKGRPRYHCRTGNGGMGKVEILREYFGHGEFREGQEGIVDAILSGRDAMGIMPTGAGKSICYQVPALMLEGITVVISPLISLMKDQVNALIQSGVRAAYLNSSLTPAQYETAIGYAERGAYKLIYVAPERLCTPSFLRFAASVRLSLVAVDEAHCVSQWGQDFRPSYMRIPEFISRLSYRPPIAAFTATATAEVKDDIIKMLGLREPYTVTTGFDRKNLYFGVTAPKDKFAETLEIIKRNEGRSGIIYCATRKKVEEVCARLNEAGHSCTRYHAGLSDEERRSNQDDFIYDRVRLIAATNAFGMGIDKSNVGFVIHYNMPKNIESYYQEAGRAGRDGSNAECILLYNGQDVRTNTFLIEQNENPDLDADTAEMLRKRDMERLRQMTFYSTSTSCLREFILRYFGEQSTPYCGCCSNCEKGFEEKDITIEAQKILSCIYRLLQRGQSAGAGTMTDILRGSKAEKIISRSYNTLSTYGIMADTPARLLRQMIAHLEQQGYLVTFGDYSVLKLTQGAKGVLSGEVKVTMRLPKAPVRSRRSEVSDGIYSLDAELFGKLKALRTRLAAEARLPAYIIFTDTALRDICIKRPTTREELLSCSGIGKSKADRYGSRIIALINDYIAENGEEARHSSLIGERQSSQTASGSNMLFKLIRFNKGKLSPAEEPLTPAAFCERILTCLGISADRRKLSSALDSWLVQNGYLAVSEGGKGRELTILSEEAGLAGEDGLSVRGKAYSTIVITPEGQRFLISYTDEIFK